MFNMLKLASFCALLLATAIPCFAAPFAAPYNGPKKPCISNREADELLHKYETLYDKLDEKVAEEILTKDFTVYSESYNYLIKGPQFAGRGIPFSTNRDDFISGVKAFQATLPPDQINTVLDSIYSCDKIFYRYKHTFGPDPAAAEFGFDELYLTRKDNGKWKVQKDYTEYNSVIGLVMQGKYPCTAANTPTPGT